MITIRTYRGVADLESRIKTALSLFWAEFKRQPGAIILPTSEAEAGRELVARLSPSSKVEVRGSGGVLIPEVWLQVPERKQNGAEADPTKTHERLAVERGQR